MKKLSNLSLIKKSMQPLPKYEVQEAKIISAYMDDTFNPYDADWCVCGILSPTKGQWMTWYAKNYEDMHCYSIVEYREMERYLFNGIKIIDKAVYPERKIPSPEAVFEGIKMALEVLKGIHVKREIKTEIKELV